MKFCLLVLQGSDAANATFPVVCFATNPNQLNDPQRVFTLSRDLLVRINPNTRNLPLFRTRADAELTAAIYARVPVLVDEPRGANPWGVRFQTMFHMANDSGLFRTTAELRNTGFTPDGPRMVRGDEVYLPLYEAKQIWHYDHRFGDYAGSAERSTTSLPTPDDARHADPTFVVQPWYWVPAAEVAARLRGWERTWLIGFRDITNATNERTAIVSLVPAVGVGHTLPLVMAENHDAPRFALLLANLNALVLDWVMRQKLGGTHLTFFIFRQLPVLPPTGYTAADLRFIVPRVLELVYTAWDVAAFAADVWATADADLRTAIRTQWEENRTVTGGVDPHPPTWAVAAPLPPFRWHTDRRAILRAELDAYYARLYGLTRKQLRYILDPADLTTTEIANLTTAAEEVPDPLDPDGYAARVQASTFPSETFRVLKEKELRHYGEYRTRRLVLEAWTRLTTHP
ncbi:MAG: hypothetical protein KatS3mg055_0760 [Chloroflexus sp.]|nr:MAG: hypothetical protein KatS3mg055_0760 [Chloroflexus sp.]